MAMRDAKVISTNILENQSLSGGVDLGNHELLALELPETFNTTTLTFQAKAKVTEDQLNGDNLEDWDNVYNDAGTELSITVAANRVVGLRQDIQSVLAPIRYLRIRSGTSAAPVPINPGALIKFLVK